MLSTALRAIFSIMSVKTREKILSKTLHSLGIGSGAGVHDSGEEGVIKLLWKINEPNTPLCVFDVGANVGNYAKSCIKHLAGGGQ